MTHDVLIVGAGPAGLAFARSLADSGLKIALIEKRGENELERPSFDGRDIALTHLSVRILEELGIWERLAPHERPPIKRASVLNGTSPYCLDFDGGGEPSDALGFIVSNHLIRAALFDSVTRFDNIEVHPGVAVTSVSASETSASVCLSDGRTMRSRLVVAADSRFSETRRMAGIAASMRDFGRICIVSRMKHQRPHDGVAFECFHYGRTLAVLPLSGERSSIVVTAPMQQRDAIMRMTETRFAEDIGRRFDNRYGNMTLVSERFAYPLVGVHASRFHAARFALIGDAAVGMHPVTAHGYNLGLSGQDILAREISAAAARGQDIGSRALLARYERRHMRTTRPMYHGTNEMVRFFTDDRPVAKLARGVGLRLADNIPPIKRLIRNKLTEKTNRMALLPSFLDR